MRPVSIETGYTKYAEGSVLIRMGDTVVLCNATVDEKVPPWMKGKGSGWVTAEYAMLPRSTKDRKVRDSVRGQIDGRSAEIQRLIGRSLRAAVNLDALGERSIWVDCDVLQADGGTRCASVTGGAVALAIACRGLVRKKALPETPFRFLVAAASVALSGGKLVLDPDYRQDVDAAVDANVVMTEEGRLVEVQGTAEEGSFTREEWNRILDTAETGIRELFKVQKAALEKT
jgi:ribonuclease PH